jgi:hypothetical protein
LGASLKKNEQQLQKNSNKKIGRENEAGEQTEEQGLRTWNFKLFFFLVFGSSTTTQH